MYGLIVILMEESKLIKMAEWESKGHAALVLTKLSSKSFHPSVFSSKGNDPVGSFSCTLVVRVCLFGVGVGVGGGGGGGVGDGSSGTGRARGGFFRFKVILTSIFRKIRCP